MSLQNRYDFVLVFDVQDGNPNGDPDADNLPRTDPETGQGLVTDVCLKRKVRNYVLLTKNGRERFDIFVKEKAVLNRLIEASYSAEEINLTDPPRNPADGAKRREKGHGQGSEVDQARQRMCASYYDVRTFGAVMSTGANAGQVRGPVQLTFSRSVDPVVLLEHSITRIAVATEGEAEKQGGGNRTMGRKSIVPYGIYVCHGFVSAALADQTGFDEADLALLWEALERMFESDRAAARGLMTTRRLIVFKHGSQLGNAPAAVLFEMVRIHRKAGVEVARRFADYEVIIPAKDDLPRGVTLERGA
jgi:CRISPR-associated protein Csd2